jgi:phosphoribosylcarboxyaminoimidazole (NCAIR) mutase
MARRTMRVALTPGGRRAVQLDRPVAGGLGVLPPAVAAAAQSLPDLGIPANSSRLLVQRFPGAS